MTGPVVGAGAAGSEGFRLGDASLTGMGRVGLGETFLGEVFSEDPIPSEVAFEEDVVDDEELMFPPAAMLRLGIAPEETEVCTIVFPV